MRGAAIYWEAARPRTLPAAVAPVLVGTAAAGRFLPGRFALALLVALLLQVGVNYANDYFDGVGGVDTAARVGPRRAVAAGLVSPAAMKRAMLLAFAAAGVAGLTLALIVDPRLLLLGVLCLAAAVGYSGGPKPYASAGMGELFVFVFFGLVATIGSAYAQAGQVPLSAVVAAVPVGLLAGAILVVNNLRDIGTDAAAGKRTLAVRLGEGGTLGLFTALVAGAFALVPVVALTAGNAGPLAALLAVPLGVGTVRGVRAAAAPPELIACLGATARLELVVAVLLAVGLWVA